MRKLTIAEHISLDGIIQHSADDDSFPYGEWTVPFRTPAGRDALLATYGDTFDLLLGRRTYDLWAPFWPTAPAHPLRERINAATKYIVTHRPDSLSWGPTQPLGPDLVADVRAIRSQPGPDIILAGSSTLTSPLIEHGLADELLLIVYPVLLGAGKRLFADGAPARAFTLISTQTTPAGVMLSRYKLADPLPRH